MKQKYIVGSRKSQLAMTQTQQTINRLQEQFPEVEFEIKGIVTKGDRLAHAHLSTIGGKGVFMKKIEESICRKEIDFAVHSMKDVPSILPDEVTIGAIPSRNSPWDCLIAKHEEDTLDTLPQNSVIGTSSVRRGAQLLAYRPDFHILPIRGNIDTRLKKLHDENYDAIILAEAGMNRLGWEKRMKRSRLSKDICLPAIGQGALAIECLKARTDVVEMLKVINCQDTNTCVTAERTFLAEMDGSCTFPIGGYAEFIQNEIHFTGFLGSVDGQCILKETLKGNDPVKLGKEMAQTFYQKGAKEIMKGIHENNG